MTFRFIKNEFSNPATDRHYILRHRVTREFLYFTLLTIIHLPLGVMLYNFPWLGVVHSLAVLFYGLYTAQQDKAVSRYRTACIIAYLTGTEILWRMSETPIYWEFGKYAASLLMVVALYRRQRADIPILPVVYFLLLIPACFLTLFNNDLEIARAKLSSNLSGPLSLFVSCCFFYNLKLNWLQLRRLLLWLMIPVITTGFTTLFYTMMTPDIAFNTESNYATSGGFGPNQVSSVLGMGAFAAIFCYLTMNNARVFRFYYAAVFLFLIIQGLLTFSRGGIYNALGAAFFSLIPQLFDSVRRRKILSFFALLSVIAIFALTYLNEFTGGKLQERFESADSSNRLTIIDTDFDIWEENPILGIGAGEAKSYRRENFGFSAASHTEFSRLLSEHGAFGILALLALLTMTIFNLQQQKSAFGQALVIGFVAWSSLYMLNAGMRLLAPSFLFGLTFIALSAVRSRKMKSDEPIY